MLKIKLRTYNVWSKECNLCKATPDNIWKFGRVSVTIRAQHFCDVCIKLIAQ